MYQPIWSLQITNNGRKETILDLGTNMGNEGTNIGPVSTSMGPVLDNMAL